MESFVSTLVDEMSSTTVGFVTTVITSYWGILLSLAFVGFIAYKFRKFGHMK